MPIKLIHKRIDGAVRGVFITALGKLCDVRFISLYSLIDAFRTDDTLFTDIRAQLDESDVEKEDLVAPALTGVLDTPLAPPGNSRPLLEV